MLITRQIGFLWVLSTLALATALLALAMCTRGDDLKPLFSQVAAWTAARQPADNIRHSGRKNRTQRERERILSAEIGAAR